MNSIGCNIAFKVNNKKEKFTQKRKFYSSFIDMSKNKI